MSEKAERLLQLIAEDQGFDDVVDLIEANIMDSCVPGICRSCEEVTEPHEPDATKNWCELCGENEVVACTELMYSSTTFVF